MKTIALLDALRAHYIPELLKRNDIGEGLFGEPLLLHNDRGDRFIGDTGTIAIAVTVLRHGPGLVLRFEFDGLRQAGGANTLAVRTFAFVLL